MTASEFFFVSAGIAMWLVVVVLLVVLFAVLKLVRTASREILSIKNTLKLSGLTWVGKLLGGGDNRGRKK